MSRWLAWHGKACFNTIDRQTQRWGELVTCCVSLLAQKHTHATQTPFLLFAAATIHMSLLWFTFASLLFCKELVMIWTAKVIYLYIYGFALEPLHSVRWAFSLWSFLGHRLRRTPNDALDVAGSGKSSLFGVNNRSGMLVSAALWLSRQKESHFLSIKSRRCPVEKHLSRDDWQQRCGQNENKHKSEWLSLCKHSINNPDVS